MLVVPSSTKRSVMPPNLIPGRLSPRNAGWLARQLEVEREHRRKVASARARTSLGRAGVRV